MLHYDDSAHPLVRMTITGLRTAEDSKACIDRIATLLDAGIRFVLVVADHSIQERPFSWLSLRTLRWAVERWGRLRRMCAGVAVVVDEQRLIKTPRAARSLLPPMPVPVSIFGDAEMANIWVQSQLVTSQGRAVNDSMGCETTATVAWHPVSSAYADLGC